jgi:hypothetical protein
MRIEFLYPELCNLYGDAMNVEYLCRALPEAEIIKTPLKATPAFSDGDISMVYMGSMTEGGQSLAADALRPHRERISELIDSGAVFLITGNAMELFGTRIENEDGSHVQTLGLLDLYAKRQMLRRYNSIYLGMYDEIEIVGFKSQFSHSYSDGGETNPQLFKTLRGAGRKPGQAEEGVRINNFLATYVLGPLLILNPQFTHYLLRLMGATVRELPYEQAARASYEARLREFHDPKTGEEY